MIPAVARPSQEIPDAVTAAVSVRMRELALSPADLAREASRYSKVSDATVRHLVNGTRSSFSDATIYAVSRGLGWSANAIHRMIDGADAPEPVAGDAVDLGADPDLDEVLRKVQEAMDAMEAFKRAHERKERR